jgi:hypothetical protein
MNSLTLARNELRNRAAAVEGSNPREAHLLEQLDPVLDYVGRIVGHPESHYRADKAGSLLLAAVTVYGDCFARQSLGSDKSDAVGAAVRQLHALVAKLDGLLWAFSTGEPLPKWRVTEWETARDVLSGLVAIHTADATHVPPTSWSCLDESHHPDDQCEACQAGIPEDCDVYGTEEVY